MEHGTLNAQEFATLRGVFELSLRDIAPSLQALHGRTGAPLQDLPGAISNLRDAGLIQSAALRLTMSGLVAAASLPALPRAQGHRPTLSVVRRRRAA